MRSTVIYFFQFLICVAAKVSSCCNIISNKNRTTLGWGVSLSNLSPYFKHGSPKGRLLSLFKASNSCWWKGRKKAWVWYSICSKYLLLKVGTWFGKCDSPHIYFFQVSISIPAFWGLSKQEGKKSLAAVSAAFLRKRDEMLKDSDCFWPENPQQFQIFPLQYMYDRVTVSKSNMQISSLLNIISLCFIRVHIPRKFKSSCYSTHF